MVAPTIWYPYLVAYVAQHVILRIAPSSRFDVDVVEDLEHCPHQMFGTIGGIRDCNQPGIKYCTTDSTIVGTLDTIFGTMHATTFGDIFRMNLMISEASRPAY